MTIRTLLNPFTPMQRRHLGFLRQMALVQHRLLDQSTMLGYMWSFFHPLLMLTVLWLFFSRQIGQGIAHYPVYLLIGIVQFTHIAKSTSSAMRVLFRMRSVSSGVIFPKDLLIYSALLADLPEFLISMVLVVAIALASGIPAGPALLALPAVIAAQVLRP
jgi:ABC-type polysaccharide/polyol phosphate export permease